MNSSFNHLRAQPSPASERSIHPDKLDQIIEAIASGKYSWACVLLLRFSGYNPLHYIPYSTYNRIIKDGEPRSLKADPMKPRSVNLTGLSREDLSQSPTIDDLEHLEPIPEESHQVNGGFSWLAKLRW